MMNKYYQPGLRLYFGHGDKMVHAGHIDEVPSLIISNRGVGKVGVKDDFTGNLPSGQELCAFIFENIESLDVVIEELGNLRERFDAPAPTGYRDKNE